MELETQEVSTQTVAIQSAGSELAAQAERAVIDSDDSASRMTDLLGIVKARLKSSEDARKALVKPLNDHVKWINDQFKGATEDLRTADALGRRKLNAYLQEKEARERAERERQRREAEERALEEASRLEASGKAKEAEALVDSAALIPEAPKSGPTRGAYGASAAQQRRWTFEVTDINKVPTEFLVVDAGLVRAEIRNGLREIPGLRIFQESSVSIR